MDEKKQIEEMAKDIKELYYREILYSVLPFDKDSYDVLAEKLYKRGYQNCKDKVVLTREEYSDYLILQQNHEFIRERAKELQADNERLYKNLGKFKDIARKETAREIIETAKFLIEERNGMDGFDLEDVSVDGVIVSEVFDELAKQYGVEVEE